MRNSFWINIKLLFIAIIFLLIGCKKDIPPVDYDECFFKKVTEVNFYITKEYESEYIEVKRYLSYKDQHLIIYEKNGKTFIKHFNKDLNEVKSIELEYASIVNSVQLSAGILYWISKQGDLTLINEYEIQTKILKSESLPANFNYLFFYLDKIDNKTYLSCYNTSLSEIDLYYFENNAGELQFINKFKPPYIGSEISQSKVFKTKNDIILTTIVVTFSKSFLFDFSLSKKDTVYKESFDYQLGRTRASNRIAHNQNYIFLTGSDGNNAQIFIYTIENKNFRKAINTDGDLIYVDDNYIVIDKDNLYSLSTFEPFLDQEKFNDIYTKSNFINSYIASDSLYIYKRGYTGYTVEAINKQTGCADKYYNLAKNHIYINFELNKLISLDEHNIRMYNLK